MKFLKENWYKLMTGTAMLIFACGFFIYAVSPSYANETSEENLPSADSKDLNNVTAVASDGYLYVFNHQMDMWTWAGGFDPDKPLKRKLP